MPSCSPWPPTTSPAAAGDLADRLRLVHFRENAAEGQMTFDYLMREGAVTEGNTRRLMRSLGLDVPLDDA